MRAARLLEAQAKAAQLFAAVEQEGVLAPGVLDSDASAAVRELAAQRFGVSRHWHKRIIRYEQIGHRLAEADARIGHAQQLVDANRHEPARAELDRADAICRPGGAHGIVRRADQQRARLPREVPTPGEGP